MWSGETDDRPRERLLRHGPRRLSDVELVALVLRNGRSGQTALELAHTLVRMHRDVRGLADARADVLADYSGMGPAKAAAIAAAFELGRRTTELAEAVPLRRAEDIVLVARREARGMRRDEVLVFVTDVASRVRWTVPVARGTPARASTVVRQVLDAVRAHRGAGFAVARLTSSEAVVTAGDLALARRLHVAASYADVHFLDFVVVDDVGWCGVLTASPVEEAIAATAAAAPAPSPAGPAGPAGPDGQDGAQRERRSRLA
jgi:DNA repair protein RadC